MYLKLINFKCYEKKEFNFADSGLTLITGQSGAGKSTIMAAIDFVLYGEGRKVCSHKAKTCSVEFRHNNWIIIRSKTPNLVTLTDQETNSSYQNDSADAMIKQRYGSEFSTISYLKQNGLNSFIAKSPTEKVEFLEQFAFSNINLVNLKNSVTKLTREANDKLTAVTSKLQFATDNLKKFVRPQPVPCPYKSTKPIAMKNEEIRIKNNIVLIKRTETKLETLKQEHADNRVYTERKTSLSDQLTKIETKLAILSNELDQIDYIGDDSLLQLETQLLSIIEQKELIILKDRYEQDKKRLEEMVLLEIEEYRKKIADIELALWSEYNSNEVDQHIRDYQDMERDVDQMNKLKLQLNKLNIDNDQLLIWNEQLDKINHQVSVKKEKYDRLKTQQQLRKCPSCHAVLRLVDNELVKAEQKYEYSSEDISKLEKDIKQSEINKSKLETNISETNQKIKQYNELEQEIDLLTKQYETLLTKQELTDNIEYFKEYKRSQIELDKTRKLLEQNIRDKIYSNSVQKLRIDVNKQKESISVLEKKYKNNKIHLSEQELRVRIDKQRLNKEKFASLSKQITELQREQDNITELIQHNEDDYGQKYTTRVISEIETELKSTEKELQDLIIQKNHYDKLSKDIDNYKNYQKELQIYTELDTELNTIQQEEKVCRDEYNAYLVYRDKIQQAENISFLSIIDSINSHAQDYLDDFFPDNPITIQLQAFKENNKKIIKPSINLEISYKGSDIDISSLSGGEFSRIVLAFTLALAEIFNSPLILLDECTSSLDQELNSIVMDSIKKSFPDKVILVIAHQVVAGDYDQQLYIVP